MPGRDFSRKHARTPSQPDKAPTRTEARPASIAQTRQAQARPAAAAPRAILALQRQYGNRAVRDLVQREPLGGPAGEADAREAEAAPATQAPTDPTRTLGSSARVTAGATAGLVQLKRALVSTPTTSRLLTAPLTDKGPADSKTIEKSRPGKAYKRLESVDLAEGSAPHIRDSAGNFAWYRLRGGSAREYIRAAKIIGGLAAAPATGGEPAQAEAFDKAGYAGTMIGAVDDYLVGHIRGISLAGGTASTNIVLGESATWAGAGLLGMAVGLRDLFSSEASAWDRVNAYLTFASGTASVLGAATQVASTQYASGSQLATENATSSAWMLGFADMFTTLANGVKTLKGVVDLVKMAVSDQKSSKAAYLQTGADVLTSGLETAKGVLRTIRGVNEALAGGTVSTQFQQVLPGFDIAIAAVKTITQGYYLIVSAVQWKRMYKRQAEVQQELVSQGKYTVVEIKAALTRFASEEAMSAKLGDLLAITQSKIDTLTVQRDKLPADEAAKRDVLTAKIGVLEEKKRGYEGRKEAHERTSRREEARGGPTRKELEEMDLSGELALANKRRVTRQAVHISMNLAQIAGAIASLVSGPGAPAALGLKLAAAGVDASLPLFRWIKQKGRDTAAANLAKGKSGASNRIFNADKSTAGKLAARKKQAVVILMMVHKLNGLIPRAADEATRAREVELLKAQMRRVEAYIGASGCPPEKLYAAVGKPDEQIKILVKELARRELG